LKFTKKQKQTMRHAGIVHLRRLVSTKLVEAARRDVNRAIGRSSSYGKEDASSDPQLRTLWPSLAAGPSVSALFYETPVKSIVEDLLGEGSLNEDLPRTVLLRFPQEPSARESTAYHVDGFEYQGGRDARQAPADSHTVAVAVLLTDVPRPMMGNLGLIPKSHHALARYIRARPEAADDRRMPPLALGTPVPVTGRAGDVVIYHHAIAHSAFAFRNLTADIHCAAIFWASRKSHDRLWREALADPWLEWPGMGSKVRTP
jgi:hypothetical protein